MPLYSHYLIDGVPQEMTPAGLLDAVSASHSSEYESREDADMVIDESVDPSIEAHDWNPRKIDDYLKKMRGAHWRFPLPFAEMAARGKVAEALIDAIWCKGHFRLEDLALRAVWKWNEGPVGASAAFYRSVAAAVDYIDALGVHIDSYRYLPSSTCELAMRCVLSRDFCAAANELGESDKSRPRLGTQRLCPARLESDPSSWLVYIPFDTSDYRLGGSLLAQSQGLGGGVSIQVNDPDYFMDCYEVVRELVEDGIVIAGATVSAGGLLAAVDRMCENGPGTTIDISGITRAFEENNAVRVLFSEVPGVVIQIRDMDFDYLDAELLLQDVVFFPIGHPSVKSRAVKVRNSERSGIQTILDALMQNAEGED